MADEMALNGPEVERAAAGSGSVAADVSRAIAQRAEAAEKAGLPASAIRFLTGEDPDTLTTQAESLAGLLAQRAPRPRLVVPGEGSHPATQRAGSALEDTLRQTLGMPAHW